MSDSLKSLAQHYLLDSVIYGPMLTPEQHAEAVRQKAERLAQKAKARMELEELMAQADKMPTRFTRADFERKETPSQQAHEGVLAARKEIEKQLELLKQLGELDERQLEIIGATLLARQRDLRADADTGAAQGVGSAEGGIAGKEGKSADGVRGPDEFAGRDSGEIYQGQSRAQRDAYAVDLPGAQSAQPAAQEGAQPQRAHAERFQ